MNLEFVKKQRGLHFIEKGMGMEKTTELLKEAKEAFYCNQDDGEYNNNPCAEQCRFCKGVQSL